MAYGRVGLFFGALILLVGSGYFLSFVRYWGISGSFPRPYWTDDAAREALDQVRQKLHLGMPPAEAIAAARLVGARLYAIGEICRPGEACDEEQALKSYSLSINIARMAPFGASALVLTVEVRNGLVSEIGFPSDTVPWRRSVARLR